MPDFELPSASPRVHGLVGRVISARRGESQFGREQEAEVALGENFPLVSLRGGPHPISLGLGSQVYARFSLEDAQTAMISHDWVVGINTTAALGRWDVTLQLYHESSHLGDEYGDRFATTRLDWSREVLAGWAGYTAGPWRFSANASYAVVDALGLPRTAGAAAIDFKSRPALGVTGGRLRPTAGVFFAADAATAWRVSASARLGVAVPTGSGGEIGVALIAHDGLSTQRQFYGRKSRYVGVELRFDL
ncbi:MAG: DUF1207 domain-containing protein [Gemmatimonadales bacterium]|nr:DUF1207 domain-containing protein [Gemmatimonadales bacterium]